MTNKSLRGALALIVSLGVAACDNPDVDSEGAKHSYTSAEITEEASRFHQNIVRVRGYLSSVPGGGTLHSRRLSKQELEDPFFLRHSIGVLDNSPDYRLAGEHWSQRKTCTDHYAQVVGRFVYTEANLPFTIYDVHEIRVWPDGNFEGEGQLCLEKTGDFAVPDGFSNPVPRASPSPYDQYKYPGHYRELYPEAFSDEGSAVRDDCGPHSPGDDPKGADPCP